MIPAVFHPLQGSGHFRDDPRPAVPGTDAGQLPVRSAAGQLPPAVAVLSAGTARSRDRANRLPRELCGGHSRQAGHSQAHRQDDERGGRVAARLWAGLDEEEACQYHQPVGLR